MAARQAAETLVVFSKSSVEEVGIRTLVGDYVEVGTNHSRKTYQKTERILGMEDMDVFLYYWEDSDSTEWSGWWFGDQVGGTQVWSYHPSNALKPPKTGWSIPWDGPVKNELCVMNKTMKQMEDRDAAKGALLQARNASPMLVEVDDDVDDDAPSWDARADQAANRAAEVEVDARQVIDNVKALKQKSELEQARQDLLQHQKAVTAVQKFVSAETLAAKATPLHLKQDLQSAALRVRKLQADLKEALLLLQKKLATEVKAEEMEAKAEFVETELNPLENEHMQQLEEMMPGINEKIQNAEDEVEKVTIAAAPLKVETGEDLRPVMLQAIKDTEKAVRAAQAAIGEARRFISGKMSQVARFAGASRQQAIDEFAHLQEKLNEAQKRLNPFKSARQDYEKRAQMRKLYEELSSKLASAEIEVEKAGMMTAPMGFDSQESVKETESSLATAQSMLAQTHRQVESKLRQKDVEVSSEFKGLLERCKLGQEKLDEVRKALRETQVRIAADLLMKEVSDRVANAEDEIQKMAEAELPFLRSDKDQDLATLFSEADKVSVQVHGVLAETQSFVARKMVEVAKYSEGPGQAVKEEVEMLQKRLEEGRERLQQFRSNIADRKRTHLLEEVEVKVLVAEEEVKKMTDVANVLPGLGKAGEILTEQLGETLEQANQAERAAQASVVTARKFLLQKTADLKKLAMAGASGGSGSELGRLQTRVNGMQQEIAKLRNNISLAEERQRVKQQLAEVVEKLQMVETEVQKVAAVPDKDFSTEQLQSIEKANGSVKVKVEQLGKLIDIKLKSASGFMQEELTALRLRLSKAEKKLDKMIQAAQEQRERILATELVAQSRELVEISETELRKASQAELPFLKGFEIQLAEMHKCIGECEAAAAQTKKAITQARSSTMENLAKAKSFAESVSSGCSKELMALQKRLDQMAAKLTALNKETTERKRKVQLQNIKEKIPSVEEAVKNFEEKVKGLNDTEILLSLQSSEEAIARFKEATSLEDAAKVLIDGARQILAKANSDAKTLSESQRVPFMTEMGKLQSRLTPVQVQFKKLSVDCTTAEHGYVAHSLSKEVEGSLKRMTEQKDLAAEACSGLLEEIGHSKVLAVLRRDALVDVLQDLLKFVTLEELWADLAAGADSVQQKEFGERLRTRLGSLPFGACITQDHLASVWPLLGLSDGGLTEAAFKALLRDRRLVLQPATLWDAPEGGEHVSKLYQGEHVQVVEDHPGGHPGERLHCRVLRDGRSFWVDGGNDGEGRDALCSVAVASQLESLQTFIKALAAECGKAATECEQKAAKVANVAATSKLLPARNTLLEASKKMKQEKSNLDELQSRLTAAKDAALEEHQTEVKQLEEAKAQAYMEQCIGKATEAVKGAEATIQEVAEKSKECSVEFMKDMPAADMEALMKLSQSAKDMVQSAQATIKEIEGSFAEERVGRGSRRFMLQVRVTLTRLKAVLKTAAERSDQWHESISSSFEQVQRRHLRSAKMSLRFAFRRSQVSPDAAFQQVARGNSKISKEDFLSFVATLPEGHGDIPVSQEQASMVFDDFGKLGMQKINFLKAVQEYGVCSKEVTMTSSFSIENSQRIRKLLIGENVEILEGSKEDDEAKVQRVRCRALKDGSTGWVTVKGNQGTSFLKPKEKPIVRCVAPVNLKDRSDDAAATLRQLQPQELLELLEGPRHPTFDDQIFLEGSVTEGGSSGVVEGFVWKEALEKSKSSGSQRHFVCKSGIAMTDVYDINNCKVVGKIQVDEVLESLDDEANSSGPLPRRRFKSKALDKEGWVTLQGNAGTVYVVESERHYILESPVPLLPAADLKASPKGELKAGQLFEVKKQVTVKRPPQVQMQARALSDESVGWICFQPGPNAPVTSVKAEDAE